MRGSLYYQTGELSKVLYMQGMSKIEQKQTGYLANAKTLETYREIWNELAIFIKSMYGIKDLQQLDAQHIEAYMLAKAAQNITEQRLELISCAIGKLELGLTKFSSKVNAQGFIYDFSIRQTILNAARGQLLVKETSDEPTFARNYDNPLALIEAIKDVKFKLAARIQYEGGARLEAVTRIDEMMILKTSKLRDNNLESIEFKNIDGIYSKVKQLQGIKNDSFTHMPQGQLLTVEKGGKPGIVHLNQDTYHSLETFLQNHRVFEINDCAYRRALINAAQATHQAYNGSHGLRWNFAQRRFKELQIQGNLSYEQALQQVSWEMKHERAEITEHYLRVR